MLILFQKLRHKGQDDFAIPVADESYGLSPELDDESDVMCKHLGVSTLLGLLSASFMLIRFLFYFDVHHRR